MSGFRKLITTGVIAASATGANAQEIDAVAALFDTLGKGQKPAETQLSDAILAAGNGQKLLAIAPDKKHAVVIDPTKKTIAAIQLATNEDGKLTVAGPVATYRLPSEKKLTGAEQNAINWEAAECITRFKGKISESAIPSTQSYLSFIDERVAQASR